MTDGELLERYVARRDQAAFRSLVTRHGPMVQSVCRHILRDNHAAEDAFQATFLVLARKAAALEHPERLGNWLYGVAYRIAARLRKQVTRRRQRERPMGAMLPEPSGQGESWHELRPLLLEELSRLPEKYRLPLVLCYLEEQSHEQTAALLGWPVGTVKVRLVRGRAVLRKRLVRRGVGVSLALLLLLLRRATEAAEVSDGLVEATVRAALATTPELRPNTSPAWPRGGTPFSPRELLCRLDWWPIFLVLVAIAALALGPLAWGWRAPDPDDEMLATLPPELTDVLAVSCQ
jgi:RNA polymerase sigma factor (sigma-70 family)